MTIDRNYTVPIDMKHGFTQRPTSFFITAPLPCPYLEGRLERRMVTELLGRDAISLHDTLSKVGFRRSHGLVYAPICPDCSECLAVRTLVDQFNPSISQRRVLRTNEDVSVSQSKQSLGRGMCSLQVTRASGAERTAKMRSKL